MGLTEQRALPGTNAPRFDRHHPLSIISFLPSSFSALISISPPEFLSCTTQCIHCMIQTLSRNGSCCCCHILSNFQTSQLLKIIIFYGTYSNFPPNSSPTCCAILISNMCKCWAGKCTDDSYADDQFCCTS